MSDLLEYKGFQGSVGFSSEDRCFYGEVLFIEGAIVFGGDTVDELEAMFQESVDGYLEMCAQNGIEPQKPFKGVFNVRVGPEIHKQAAIAARCAGISLNQFVTQAISEKLAPAKEVHNHSHMHVHESAVVENESTYTATLSRLSRNQVQEVAWSQISHH